MGDLIRVGEAATILGKHRWTVWNWVRQGKLSPAAYVGDEALFSRADIEQKARELKAKQAVA
ncbi:MAG TPA: helix-turn-helix domain-containing protein [Chloroflexia bacterium]|jgi:excisionase family DNA binding protein